MGSAGAKVASVVQGVADVYVHAGGQYEWDSAAPVAVARAAGLYTSRIDGSPLLYNQADVLLPDLIVCRPNWPRRCWRSRPAKSQRDTSALGCSSQTVEDGVSLLANGSSCRLALKYRDSPPRDGPPASAFCGPPHRCFCLEGLSGFNMERVRQEAAVSGSQLTHYFADKPALIRAVLDRQIEVVLDFHRQPSLGGLDTFDDFERWIEQNMRYLRQIGYTKTPTYHTLAGQLAKSDYRHSGNTSPMATGVG